MINPFKKLGQRRQASSGSSPNPQDSSRGRQQRGGITISVGQPLQPPPQQTLDNVLPPASDYSE